MKKTKVLVTTAIDYTNDVIHIGHAYQKILADALARLYRAAYGKENVKFLTGTDEHGTTNEKAALERNLSPLEHVTDIAKKDQSEIDSLNVSYDRFIRTTDEDHKKIASEFFKKSYEAGDIYKGNYEGLYCEGCESYKTLSELNEAGQCIYHPTRQIQRVTEENYFFRWSKYQSFLDNLITNTPEFVLPEGKKTEMLAFLRAGLEDIAVTRPKYKVGWGIECPIDDTQVIYVWFDALINYYSYGVQNGFWDSETAIIHVLGKDNAKWHVLLWPAMLKSVGYELPTTVYVHSFINLNGEKISKSRGNVIRPSELVEKYGVDVVRYYFLRHGPIVEDVNISYAHLEEVYTADLANGLGNTVSRVAKLAEKSGAKFSRLPEGRIGEVFTKHFDDYRLDVFLQSVWKKISDLEQHITTHKPWEIADADALFKVLTHEVNEIREIALLLNPFIPETSIKILNQFESETISSGPPLFPRLS